MPDKETEIEATVLKHVDKGYVSEDRVLGQRPELKKRTSHKSIWGKRGDLKLGGGQWGCWGTGSRNALLLPRSTHSSRIDTHETSNPVTPVTHNHPNQK